MENATRLQNLEVLGDLEVHGATKNGGMKEADFKVTAAPHVSGPRRRMPLPRPERLRPRPSSMPS